MKKNIFNIIFYLAILFIVLFGTNAYTQETDTIYLKDNSKHIGEIKSLSFGKLSFKTKYMGTVSITWSNITKVFSDKNMTIKTISGKIYYGSLVQTDFNNFLNIRVSDSSTRTIPMASIVSFSPIKRKKIYRVYGYVDAGFNYTKASDVQQWNLGGNVGYRTDNYDLNANFNSINTFQGDIDKKTKKQDFRLTGTADLVNKFVLPGFVSFEQNSELGIKLRTILGVGIGNTILLKPKNRVSISLSPIYNKETYAASDSTSLSTDQATMEALALLQWRAYSYVLPEFSIVAEIGYYYNLNIGNRKRLNTDISIQYELIDDVLLTLTLYDNYDTNPPSENASKNDWGTSIKIRYNFKGGQRHKKK